MAWLLLLSVPTPQPLHDMVFTYVDLIKTSPVPQAFVGGGSGPGAWSLQFPHHALVDGVSVGYSSSAVLVFRE